MQNGYHGPIGHFVTDPVTTVPNRGRGDVNEACTVEQLIVLVRKKNLLVVMNSLVHVCNYIVRF